MRFANLLGMSQTTDLPSNEVAPRKGKQIRTSHTGIISTLLLEIWNLTLIIISRPVKTSFLSDIFDDHGHLIVGIFGSYILSLFGVHFSWYVLLFLLVWHIDKRRHESRWVRRYNNLEKERFKKSLKVTQIYTHFQHSKYPIQISQVNNKRKCALVKYIRRKAMASHEHLPFQNCPAAFEQCCGNLSLKIQANGSRERLQ